MDVSRKHQWEHTGDRGQEIRVVRGAKVDREGHGIKADSMDMAPKCNCETRWAKEHLRRAQGTTLAF